MDNYQIENEKEFFIKDDYQPRTEKSQKLPLNRNRSSWVINKHILPISSPSGDLCFDFYSSNNAEMSIRVFNKYLIDGFFVPIELKSALFTGNNKDFGARLSYIFRHTYKDRINTYPRFVSSAMDKSSNNNSIINRFDWIEHFENCLTRNVLSPGLDFFYSKTKKLQDVSFLFDVETFSKDIIYPTFLKFHIEELSGLDMPPEVECLPFYHSNLLAESRTITDSFINYSEENQGSTLRVIQDNKDKIITEKLFFKNAIFEKAFLELKDDGSFYLVYNKNIPGHIEIKLKSLHEPQYLDTISSINSDYIFKKSNFTGRAAGALRAHALCLLELDSLKGYYSLKSNQKMIDYCQKAQKLIEKEAQEIFLLLLDREKNSLL